MKGSIKFGFRWAAQTTVALLMLYSPGLLPAARGAEWSLGTALPAVHVRGVGVYFPANGRFYVMGGRTSDSAGSDLTRPYEYDPATNTWAVKNATFPDNHVSNMACGVLTVSGTPYIYCVGGSPGGVNTATKRVFRYNPVTDAITTAGIDQWTEGVANTLPGGFTVFQNKLYILGGFTINVGVTNRIFEFSPGNAVGSQWAQKGATLPVAMGYVPATTIGSLIYMAGGATFPGAVLTDSTNSFVYNPVADSIAPLPNLIPRATGETRAVTIANEMWVLGGGRTAPNPSNEVNIYNPSSGQWRTGPPLATLRRNFPADTDGSQIWLGGGYSPTFPISLMEIYAAAAVPRTVFYGINSANNNLVRFDNTNPALFTTVAVTGLVGGDTIIGLDFRPATGQLYGLGSGNRIYAINAGTGAATQVGADGQFALAPGQAFGFDFNPVVDRIRVTSDFEQNFRINPTNGTLAGTDPNLAYAAGDPNFSLERDAGGAAYTNNFLGATTTTLFDIDTSRNVLARQGGVNVPPGTPSPNTGQLFTIGPLGINPTDDLTRANTGFDIQTLPGSGLNVGWAALTTNGTTSQLYSIDLVFGTATTTGTIGGGTPILVRALTIAPVGTFQLSAPTYSIGESGTVATITIFRNGGSEGQATVLFTTTDGSALSGADYTDSDQVVTFASGVTSQTVQIPINNDGSDEFNETVLLALQNATGAFLGSPNTATLAIVDDDVFAPTLTAQASPSVALGEAVFHTASISGSATPGGTLTFQLFGPNDTSCGGAPIFTSVVTVNGNGNYNSESFTPTTPGAYTWMVTYSGDGDHNAPASTSCGGPNQSITATDTVLGNISTRLRVETGDNVLIAGFIITGTQPKKVIVRGIGSSLPLAEKLADPTLELRDAMGALVEANDNWMDSPNMQAIIDSTIPPSNDLESAIVATLAANNASYTAILRGANNGTGIGVVEAYDLDRLVDSELANISTRGFVSTGDNILIAGTIVVGKNSQRVIVRAIGPSLPLANKMADPTLELRDGNGALIEANDNWMDSPNKQAIIDTTIPPSNDLESAIVAILPGNNAGYTAIVRGVNDSTGIAVVEVYALP